MWGIYRLETCDLLAYGVIGGGMITGSSFAEHMLSPSKGCMAKSVVGEVKSPIRNFVVSWRSRTCPKEKQ